MSSTVRIAVYLSSHGFGHCVRTGALLEHLIARRDVRLVVRGNAPAHLWSESLLARVDDWSDRPCDVGVVQSDDLHVDVAASGDALEAWSRNYTDTLNAECERLAAFGAGVAIGDVPPLAFDAAGRVGIPSLALANFSWDWIYREMGFEEAAEQAARAYRAATLLLRATPFAPMEAFSDVRDIGLIGRRPSDDRHRIRERLGVPPADRLVLVGFRELSEGALRLPPPTLGVRYAFPLSDEHRDDVEVIGDRVSFIDALAAADIVLAKPGYGIVGDSAACGTPMLYTDRTGFPEHRVLVDWLEARQDTAWVAAESLRAGTWLEDVEALAAFERQEPASLSGIEDAVASIEALLP